MSSANQRLGREGESADRREAHTTMSISAQLTREIRAAGAARRRWEKNIYTKSEAEARHVPDLRR